VKYNELEGGPIRKRRKNEIISTILHYMVHAAHSGANKSDLWKKEGVDRLGRQSGRGSKNGDRPNEIESAIAVRPGSWCATPLISVICAGTP